MRCPQNLLPCPAHDPVQSDARWIRESASPVAIHPELLSPYPPGIAPPDATRPLLPRRAGHSPPISSLRPARTRDFAIARRTSSDRIASESRNRQRHTPYTPRPSSISSDGCQSPRNKETTILRAPSSCPFPRPLLPHPHPSPTPPSA